MMDTAGGRPANTLIMSWQCVTNTDRHARAHTYTQTAFKRKALCSCDSRNVLGSATMSLSNVLYLIIPSAHMGSEKWSFQDNNSHREGVGVGENLRC